MSYSFFGQLWVMLLLVALGPVLWAAQWKLKSAPLPRWLMVCLRVFLQLLIVLALVGFIWGWQQRTESGRQGFRFDHQIYLLFALLAVPIIWLGQRSLAALETPRRWAALILRLAVLSAFIMLLAGLQGVRRQDELTVVVMMDLSESVRRFAQPPIEADDSQMDFQDWAVRWILAAAKDKRPDDHFRLIVFDGRPRARAMDLDQVTTDRLTIHSPTGGTDVAEAIRQGMAWFPSDTAKRMVLAWDGHSTASSKGAGAASVLAAAAEAKASGIPIDVLPIEYQVNNEVMVKGVYAPTEARKGQTVPIRVVLQATAPASGRLFIEHDDLVIDLAPDDPEDKSGRITAADWYRVQGSGDAPDQLGRFESVKIIELPMTYRGANRFKVHFIPDESFDRLSDNNSAQTFTIVHGQGKVLLVDHVGGEPGSILANALRRRGMDVQVVPGSGTPADLLTMNRYDALILQNVPAEMVSPSQQHMLARYVHDMGGGLITVGGPDSYGAGGWTNTPLEAILPVNCYIPSIKVLPAGALVIVLDRSGSMRQSVAGSGLTKQVLANEASVLAVKTLFPQDLIGVIAFNDKSQWVVELTPNNDPDLIEQQINSIQADGGTVMAPAMAMAFNALKDITPKQAAVKHVILLTDGQSQPGPFEQIAKKMAKANITLSTVAIGDAAKSHLLKQLASIGGGQYYEVNDPKRLPQIFIKEARTVRRSLVKEQLFEPQLVATGSPVMVGLGQPPMLKGLVVTSSKRDARVYQPMLGPDGEPLFAHWQVGLGRVASFTSDANNKWADLWLSWSGYDDFWARTGRMVARASPSRAFDLNTQTIGDRLHIRLDTSGVFEVGPSDSARFFEVTGTVVTPQKQGAKNAMINVKLKQVGPDLYETTLPAESPGSYIVNLMVRDASGQSRPVPVFGGANKLPGEELRAFKSDRKLVERIAKLTGGRVLDPIRPDQIELFNRGKIVGSRSIRPMRGTLLIWLLVLFLLDVACRRIAWDPFAIKDWFLVRFIAAFGVFQSRPSEKPVGTLAALKARQATTEQNMAQDSAAAMTPAPAAQAKQGGPDPDADEKEIIDLVPLDSDADTPKDKVAGKAKPSKKELEPEEPLPDGPTTSRLLNLKRRMRKRREDKK